MTDDEVLAQAHREAWRYKKSSDPHHSDTYTFNRATLLEFARKITAEEREACAKVCESRMIDKYAANAILEDCARAIRMRPNGPHEGRPD